MIQMILTYTILILVIGYVVYKLTKTLFPGKQESMGCGSGCGCDAKKLKEEIIEVGKNKNNNS